MKYRFLILCVFALLSFGVAIAAITKRKAVVHHADDILASTMMDLLDPVDVRRIEVIEGNEFDLTLADERRINGLIDVKVPAEAKKKVLEFLNRSYNPRVILKSQQNGKWIVQLYVTADSPDGPVEIDLATWLRENGLSFD